MAALAVLGVSRAMVLASSFGFKHYGRFLVLKQAKSKLKVQGKPLIFVGCRLAKLAQNFGLRSTSLTPAEHVCEQQRLVEVLSQQILPPSPRGTPAPAAVCVCVFIVPYTVKHLVFRAGFGFKLLMQLRVETNGKERPPPVRECSSHLGSGLFAPWTTAAAAAAAAAAAEMSLADFTCIEPC